MNRTRSLPQCSQVSIRSITSTTPSCERRSLVLIDVQASAAFDAEPVHLQNVRLTVTANRDVTTRFPPVRLSTDSVSVRR